MSARIWKKRRGKAAAREAQAWLDAQPEWARSGTGISLFHNMAADRYESVRLEETWRVSDVALALFGRPPRALPPPPPQPQRPEGDSE